VLKDLPEITEFLERAEKDVRLGPLHISLYISILYCWLQQGGIGPARVTGKELMPLSKISGYTPMYKTLRDLHTWGYIEYRPSHSMTDKSKIYLPLMEKMGYHCKG
jgi:hypothetical protein